jgi:hypothetical protein
MSRLLSRITIVLLFSCLSLLGSGANASAQETTATPTSTPQQQPAAPPALEEWGDTFDGNKLDETKWERFTFQGGSGGKVELKDGQLRMRGADETRAGVRSLQDFTGERFIVEATITKVGAQSDGKPGTAILTVLFDGSERNRIEWLLTSEGIFEAWVMIDGQGERFDNRKTGTKVSHPTISIARKGDDYFFALNGQVGLQKNIKNMPRSFRVMLYGFGSSENNWDSVRVVTVKQAAK